MSKFHMTSSYTYTASKLQLNFSSLQEICSRMGITLTKFSDSQLESTYAMQGFKATGQKSNEICFVFVSLIEQIFMPVYSYFNGTLIFTKNLKNESQIAEFIKGSLEIVRDNFVGGKRMEEEYKELERLFDNLYRNSEKILNKSSNEMMAIQEIKSSPEYMQICKYGKRLSEDVQGMCKAAKGRQSQSKLRNETIINQMIEVEEQKGLVQLSMFKYSQMIKQIVDVQAILDKIIAEKKKKMEGLDFHDEESFLKYLDASTEMKRLENQKKYLSKA